MAEQDFIKAGFTIVGSENNENKLLDFLKENYPNVIRDTEINLEELKIVLGLPIDDKVNGYGLNFIGRNFARAKYAQKTEKELRLNNTLSKNIDTTQNLVLKGDNLDSLKILKSHYSNKIKCIYIDPPYNTTSDEFVYPDKFDKEEAEVLGLSNLSENDFARMDFSFKTKKSHNGWLAFMYPRLLLARDLLSKDGAIFISIDDNEQANLKLLCDDVFGEENFVTSICVKMSHLSGMKMSHKDKKIPKIKEFILLYSKNKDDFSLNPVFIEGEWDDVFDRYDYYVHKDENTPVVQWKVENIKEVIKKNQLVSENDIVSFKILNSDKIFRTAVNDSLSKLPKNNFFERIITKTGLNKLIYKGEEVLFANSKITKIEGKDVPAENIGDIWLDIGINNLHNEGGVPFPNGKKPYKLIKRILEFVTNDNDIVLDFFAGSGTTGHAGMQLNAEDGGNRKFILCQLDEPIKADKPAYQFCLENNLPPVISSITIERLKRTGEKIAKDIEAENGKTGLFEEHKKQVPDIGFKVFDSVEAPKLKVDEEGQISITENETDALSRIYNMIFTVGLDEPTQVPEEIVKDSIYKIGNHYFITNSEKITSDDYSNAIKNGKVFIDGWTASLNGTLQNYKEDVKIVF
jgi:adenine-specific DNA-methyltransferase